MPDDPTLVEMLATMVHETSVVDLPDEVRTSVRRRVLDIVGLCAAAHSLPTSRAAGEYAVAQGGVAEAHTMGVRHLLPAAQAAFVHGVLAHSLDFDDTHLPSVLHPSATVIPAALAAAEQRAASGRNVIAAITAGIEVCVRLGMAGYETSTNRSLFFERGQHATSICGAIGGAAAAAKIAGLDPSGVAHAMALAVSMSGGILEANRTGGTVKRIHCGWAAHAAVVAADLAMRGFTGPPTVLEGRFGFFEAYLGGRYDRGAITTGLGTTWAVADIFFKPYPANHFTHTAIDAAIELRRGGLVPDDVSTIHIGVAEPTVRTIGEPLLVKQNPQSGYQAQFSAPYAVAAALFGGSGLGLGLDDFTDELATDPERRALMARVTVGSDVRCDALFPHQFPAVVTVRTKAGHELVVERMTNRGGPALPLTDDELSQKFTDNASRSLPASSVAALRASIEQLETIVDLGPALDPIMDAGETPGSPS